MANYGNLSGIWIFKAVVKGNKKREEAMLQTAREEMGAQLKRRHER